MKIELLATAQDNLLKAEDDLKIAAEAFHRHLEQTNSDHPRALGARLFGNTGTGGLYYRASLLRAAHAYGEAKQRLNTITLMDHAYFNG